MQTDDSVIAIVKDGDTILVKDTDPAIRDVSSYVNVLVYLLKIQRSDARRAPRRGRARLV